MKRPIVLLATDGACMPNPGRGGWGVVIKVNGTARELEGGEPDTTNNRMEVTAAIRGLEALLVPSIVTIKTDSLYLQHGVDALPRHAHHGWMKGRKPLINGDLWKRLATAMAPHHVTVVWVRGHATDEDNIRADALANRAAGITGLLRPEIAGGIVMWARFSTSCAGDCARAIARGDRILWNPKVRLAWHIEHAPLIAKEDSDGRAD